MLATIVIFYFTIPGIHHVLFDGSDLSSGIYFVQMQAGDFTQTQKLVLVK